MAPGITCPVCKQAGQWVFHCMANEECGWLRCPCGLAIYGMVERVMSVKKPKR